MYAEDIEHNEIVFIQWRKDDRVEVRMTLLNSSALTLPFGYRFKRTTNFAQRVNDVLHCLP